MKIAANAKKLKEITEKVERMKLQKELNAKAEEESEISTSVNKQIRSQKSQDLDMPDFLAPYIRITKYKVGFVTTSRDELLGLCRLIVKHRHAF